MRVSDDRYSRDRLRFDLALRFIRHEARTRTIRLWTGLTDDRIRKLYRTYLADTSQTVPRHRGKSPRQPAFFMRSPRLQHETAVLASLLSLLGVVASPAHPRTARQLPSIARGRSLCEAFEAYRRFVPESPITFEHAAFLVSALQRGEELKLTACIECGSVVVLDGVPLRDGRCHHCIKTARMS